MRGLRGRDALTDGGALFLERARSVHTIGMRFVIDVALLNRSLRVIGLVRLRPHRVLLPRRGVRHVLETPAGAGVRVGDVFARGPDAPARKRPALGALRGD